MRKSSKKLCYFCGAPCESGEHVPPKQMFKGFLCDKITVPSCDKHNSSKSGDDEAIIKAMLISLDNTSSAYSRNDEVLKAIEQARPHFRQVKQKVKTADILADARKDLHSELAYLKSSVDIHGWMRQLTAALVYDVIEHFDPLAEWKSAQVWSPNWVSNEEARPIENERLYKLFKHSKDLEQLLNELEWHSGWPSGAKNYPASIYQFSLHFALQPILIKHVFFSSYTWYVGFEPSSETREKLNNIRRQRLDTEADL